VSRRQGLALLALLGLLVAAYLALYKAGAIGTLACGVGSCETVQLSRWATLLGVPVALWGVAFYAVLFGVALVALQDAYAASRAISLALLVLTGWGVLFSAWLTYLELFVIHAICQWCVVSAILVTIAFVVAWVDWRRLRSAGMSGASAGVPPDG
jgi:uncharacterized membrane protein